MTRNEELLKKLRDKRQAQASGRRCGMRQEVAQVLNRFPGQDLDDIREEMKDMKGLRKKQAKKCLQRVMSSVDESTRDEFTKTVSEKLPEHSPAIRDLVASAQQHKRKTAKPPAPSSPSPTVPVPAQETIPEGQKKKTGHKGFAKVQVQIPKISELQREEAESSAPALPEKPLERPSYRARMEALQRFNRESLGIEVRQQLFEARPDDPPRTIVEVVTRPIPKDLRVPDTEVELEVCPPTVTPAGFCYRTEDGRWYRSVDGHPSAVRHVGQYAKVIGWLRALVGHAVPWGWLRRYLFSLGILEESQTVDDQRSGVHRFRLLCEEYPNGQKVTVPLVPFVRVTVK